MIVFPGGVDMHTHVAGAALNFARGLMPENMRRAPIPAHAGASRRSRRHHAHDVRHRLPVCRHGLDHGQRGRGPDPLGPAYPRGTARHPDRRQVLSRADGQQRDRARSARGRRCRARTHVVAWLIWAAKAYGVKAVNPGGVAAWKWGKDAKTLSEPVEGYSSVTPAMIISNLAQIVDDLELPHPLHLHCNNLGVPGNVADHDRNDEDPRGPSRPPRAPAVSRLRRRRLGHDALEAAAARRILQHPQESHRRCRGVLFGDTVTITADGPWQHLLHQLTGRKWGNLDVENETGCGIVPYTYKPTQPGQRRAVGGRARAAAAHRRSMADLPDDGPSNGACFWRYPEIIRLLMDVEFRKAEVKKLPAKSAGTDRSRRPRPPVHALGDRHHHVRGPGALAGPVPERTPRRRRGCRLSHLSREAGRRTSLRLSALRHQGRERSSSKRERCAR